jgi:hypothetical protein
MHSEDSARESDWYSVLDVGPGGSDAEITAAVERMSRRASVLANTAPHRSQELREIIRAIKRDLLSGPEARECYDLSRLKSTRPSPPSPSASAQAWPTAAPADQRSRPSSDPGVINAAGTGFGARIMSFLQTGWTCPACGQAAMPGDRFCKVCGTDIRPVAAASPASAETCAACGGTVLPGENFCTHCGVGQ